MLNQRKQITCGFSYILIHKEIMRNLIIAIGLILSITSCQKEELQPICPAMQWNMNDTITVYFERQESNGTYRSHAWSDDNYQLYLDTFMSTTAPPYTMNGWLSWSFDSVNSNPDYYIYSSDRYLINPDTEAETNWENNYQYITIPISDVINNGDTIVQL